MAKSKALWIGLGLGCGTLVLVGVGFIALCGGLAMFGVGMYKDVTKSADEFLAQLGNGDFTGAYKASSTLLQANQTEADFTAAAKKLTLTEYQSASWTSFNIVNNDATIDGTMTKKTGATLPLTMKLVKESGKWKVVSANSSAIPNVTPGEKTVPTNDKLRTMSATALNDFNQALQDKDFTKFHNTIALKWKAQITAEKLEDTFQLYIDKKISLAPITKDGIVIEGAPLINEAEVLVVEGRIPRADNAWTFRLKFLMENNEWKLFGIFVEPE